MSIFSFLFGKDESQVLQDRAELKERAKVRHEEDPAPTPQQRAEWAREQARLQRASRAGKTWEASQQASQEAACRRAPWLAGYTSDDTSDNQ